MQEEEVEAVEFEEEEPTEDPTVTANPSVKNYFQVPCHDAFWPEITLFGPLLLYSVVPNRRVVLIRFF